MFSGATYADRRLLKATAMSAIAIVFGAEVGIFQRILHTTSLTGRQWLICVCLSVQRSIRANKPSIRGRYCCTI